MVDWDSVNTQVHSGGPICLFDFPDREGETDVCYIGSRVNEQAVDFIRREVGGPLAVYVSGPFLQRLGITTFTNLITTSGISGSLRDLVRQNRGHDPRFAISIDARDNFTGCSPVESAHTINTLYDLVVEGTKLDDEELGRLFSDRLVSPGHIPIIRTADGLLDERKGHAELALTIARWFNLPEVVVAGELVDRVTLKTMSCESGRAFAIQHEFPYIMGTDVVKVTKRSGT